MGFGKMQQALGVPARTFLFGAGTPGKFTASVLSALPHLFHPYRTGWVWVGEKVGGSHPKGFDESHPKIGRLGVVHLAHQPATHLYTYLHSIHRAFMFFYLIFSIL